MAEVDKIQETLRNIVCGTVLKLTISEPHDILHDSVIFSCEAAALYSIISLTHSLTDSGLTNLNNFSVF